MSQRGTYTIEQQIVYTSATAPLSLPTYPSTLLGVAAQYVGGSPIPLTVFEVLYASVTFPGLIAAAQVECYLGYITAMGSTTNWTGQPGITNHEFNDQAQHFTSYYQIKQGSTEPTYGSGYGAWGREAMPAQSGWIYDPSKGKETSFLSPGQVGTAWAGANGIGLRLLNFTPNALLASQIVNINMIVREIG